MELKGKQTPQVAPQVAPDTKQLKKLGFDWLSKFTDAKRRLAIAYEHYKRISEGSWSHVWAYSSRTKVKNWSGEIPPNYVLDALMQAKERKCFECILIYVVGSDPLLVGVVSKNGIDGKESLTFDRPFVIANWGDDIDPSWLEKNTV